MSIRRKCERLVQFPFLGGLGALLIGLISVPDIRAQAAPAPSTPATPPPAKVEKAAPKPAEPAPAPSSLEDKKKWMVVPVHPSEILEGRGWRLFSGTTSMWIDHEQTLIQLQAPGGDALVLAPGVVLETGLIELNVRPSEKESRIWLHALNSENGDIVSLRRLPAKAGESGIDRIAIGIVSRRNGQVVKGSEKTVEITRPESSASIPVHIEIRGKQVVVTVNNNSKSTLTADIAGTILGKAVGLGAEAGGQAGFGGVTLYLPWTKGLKPDGKAGMAASVQTYGLDKVVIDACTMSTAIKTAELEMQKMLQIIKRVKTGYLPSFKIDAVAPDYRKINLNDSNVSNSQSNFDIFEASGSASVTEHLPTNTDILVRGSRTISSGSALISDRLRIQIEQEVLRKDTVAKAKSLAEEQAELQKVANRSIRRNFVNVVKRTYYNYLEARTLYYNTLQRYRDDRLLDQESEQKFRSGIIAEYNRFDYQRDYERSISRLVSRETAYLQTRTELFFLLHREDNPGVEFEDIAEKELDNIVLRPDQMLQAALHQSLDLAEMSFAIFSNNLNVSYLRDQLLPSVKLRAGTEWGKNSNDVFNDQPRSSTEYFAGVGLIMPFFADTFATNYSIQIEQTDKEITRLDLEERFRYYKKELQKDIVDLEDIYRRYRVSKDIQAVSTKDYDLSRKRFEVGAISSWDMIRSKNDYFDSLDQGASLRFEVLRRLADLERDYPVEESTSYATN
ncbi:MAG: hypothetical protein B9S32_08250 [Verrucomicrobia bacterium Tous-C9LFEB]|nr:MAG: hypothetical protein B9S32_08250 [Verrucomicrobia bacterium Tous-C9LFEB]